MPCVNWQVEKEREALRFEMNKAAAQMKEADAAIAAQKAELDKLNQIITEADQVPSHNMPQLEDDQPMRLYAFYAHADFAS